MFAVGSASARSVRKQTGEAGHLQGHQTRSAWLQLCADSAAQALQACFSLQRAKQPTLLAPPRTLLCPGNARTPKLRLQKGWRRLQYLNLLMEDLMVLLLLV